MSVNTQDYCLCARGFRTHRGGVITTDKHLLSEVTLHTYRTRVSGANNTAFSCLLLLFDSAFFRLFPPSLVERASGFPRSSNPTSTYIPAAGHPEGSGSSTGRGLVEGCPASFLRCNICNTPTRYPCRRCSASASGSSSSGRGGSIKVTTRRVFQAWFRGRRDQRLCDRHGGRSARRRGNAMCGKQQPNTSGQSVDVRGRKTPRFVNGGQRSV